MTAMNDEGLPTGSASVPPPSPIQHPRTRWQQWKGRWWVYARWMLAGLPVVMLGFAVGVGLYAFTHPDLFTSTDAAARPAPSANSFSWPLRLTRRVNILLIGADITLNKRRQVMPVSRADTLMLVNFDPERDRISIFSIPRDTRAQIPGVGETKINASFAFGGPSLTIKTVENLLGIPVHYFVKLGPDSFARLIDAIGGVEIHVEKEMKYVDRRGGLYINLTKGQQVLSGEQVMHYTRFRSDAQGDIGRVARQQKVLLALFEKLKTPATVLSAPQLFRAFADNAETNLSTTELVTLGMFAARLEAADLQMATLPGHISPDYWEPNLAKTRQLLAEMFFGIDPEMLAATAIEVLNGSGVPGLARQIALRLERLGFRIVRIDNAPTQTETTTIIDRAGRPQIARLLAEILGRDRITHQPGSGPDITIVVARDLAATHTSTVATVGR